MPSSAPAAPGFHAPWWLAGPHAQTVYGSIAAPAPGVDLRRERWDTPDVDFLDGPSGSPWIHLFHGLEGSSRSRYARTIMAHARGLGWRGSVLHFRGCSGEMNRLPRAYHSGDTNEIDWVLRRVRSIAGGARLFAVGVSLGGNALAKWLGEAGESARVIVDRAATVCAPFDLMAAGDALGRGFGLVYSRHFLATLKKTA